MVSMGTWCAEWHVYVLCVSGFCSIVLDSDKLQRVDPVVYELQLKLPWNIIADFIRFMCSEWVFGHSKIAHCFYSRSTNPKYFQVNIFTGYSAKVQLRFVCQVALPISIG